MTKTYTIIHDYSQPSNEFFKKHSFLILILFICIVILSITTITFAILSIKSLSSSLKKYPVENGIIGSPPLLPNDGKYLQWTILHLNDVYEMLPLDQQRKGGLARVAHVRELLKEENVHTYTILAGDFLSPSALSQSIVNGSALNGKQMIDAFNTLGLDFVTFGNHEFDLSQSELITRMNESKFQWISSNVFQIETNETFSISIPYYILTIEQIRILFIGLTIDSNQPYVRIVNRTFLIPFVQQFLQSISNVKYDVLIALTHLDISTDILLVENVPEIDLILGGHEHENYNYFRGSQMTPIYKSDGNAFTVYIHRCAFNLDTKRLRIYSTLTKITPEIREEDQTKTVVNRWFDYGMKGFEEMGYQPNKTVCCLPSNIELDGRSSSVRNGETLLSIYSCQSLLNSTEQEDLTVIAVFNSGSIRIDDILRGNLSEYDILRVLPFGNHLVSIDVPSQILLNVLRYGLTLKGEGMFLSFCGINSFDQGKTWLINGTEIIPSMDMKYRVITTDYAKENTDFNDPTVSIFKEYNQTHTKSLIDFLKKIFPLC